MAQYDYDLFVIGAGSGGVRAARIAAQHGARVGVAEEFRYGGTCVIRGCVPKKLFVYASKFGKDFEDAAGYGWSLSEKPSFDFAKLVEAKDAEITRLEGIYRRNLDKVGVELHDTRAVLEGPNQIRLLATNTVVTAERILIAVGAKANIDPDLPGREHVITSNEAFHMAELPKRILVAGGGYIAVEFAGIFAGMGVETTLMYRGEEILRGFDDDVRTTLHEEMVKKGINVITKDTIARIDKEGEELHVTAKSGEKHVFDKVMFAIGRSPNTEDLGLDKAGVALDDKGAIKVTADSQTNVPNIYAVGDVTNRANLTPVALREGHAFADSIYGDKAWVVDHSMIPTAVFSQPEIGTAGLTQAEAEASYDNIDIYKTSFRPMKHTLSGRDEKTMMKMIVDADTDTILGVHIMGPESGELIQLIGVTLTMGATKADYDRTIAVHPTSAEELVTMREPTERIRKNG
ncbi:glutathione-disulfide reductase [Pseudovibrio exalbescens]|uniref:glutathione-disulfide reductase n=1 Tax=Pseudovibrio exalbescens TaxID=197461 RepID=UPI002365C71E|nr:glutathione-disulfide reductase [Pseudovibrio exalbescens]MDD7908974.1 glutathione-disulfide reductase [Pseudovibrio exalbescens]